MLEPDGILHPGTNRYGDARARAGDVRNAMCYAARVSGLPGRTAGFPLKVSLLSCTLSPLKIYRFLSPSVPHSPPSLTTISLYNRRHIKTPNIKQREAKAKYFINSGAVHVCHRSDVCV